RLYVDGALAASGFKANSGYAARGDVNLGFAPAAAQDYLTGALDQVQLYGQALSADLARGLYQSWSPATLDTSGSGVSAARWSAAVPSDLEGNYQIDLTATDVLGNRNDRRIDWGLWRGEIDT